MKDALDNLFFFLSTPVLFILNLLGELECHCQFLTAIHWLHNLFRAGLLIAGNAFFNCSLKRLGVIQVGSDWWPSCCQGFPNSDLILFTTRLHE